MDPSELKIFNREPAVLAYHHGELAVLDKQGHNQM
jgi:hypothetical protein